VNNPCFYSDIEVEGLLVTPLQVKAGFVLDDPLDLRYQKVLGHRMRFGNVIHRAAMALRRQAEGEDHIDAVISVSKAIDVYLLEYAITRNTFDSLQKAYTVARESVPLLLLCGSLFMTGL
jgi:proteasome activator subunit 4